MDREVRIRVFLAIPLASLFEEEVAAFINPLKRSYPEVRWVQPSGIHVTLRFFGPVSRDEISKIRPCVIPFTKPVRPFEVFLQGFGAFPHLKRPRVLWVGMEGDLAPLKKLHREIEESLSQAGYPIEEREFKPHLTIGRVKEGGRISGLEGIAFKPTEPKLIQEAVLFESRLTPEGARYEAIETYPFSQA